MDDRKLSTLDALRYGILNLPAPEKACPPDAVLADVDESGWTEESLRTGLEAGGLAASMYYGCWSIWKTGAGFSGELLQYRQITDSFSDVSLERAMQKAQDWAGGCAG